MVLKKYVFVNNTFIIGCGKREEENLKIAVISCAVNYYFRLFGLILVQIESIEDNFKVIKNDVKYREMRLPCHAKTLFTLNVTNKIAELPQIDISVCFYT